MNVTLQVIVTSETVFYASFVLITTISTACFARNFYISYQQARNLLTETESLITEYTDQKKSPN